MLTTQQILQKYGKPGPDNLVMIHLPYPMIIDWDRSVKVDRMQCHRMVAANFQSVFKDLLDTYGLPELHRLEIDIFGGCYMYRKMRGGTEWSRHSWGIAIDLNPSKNSLKTSWLRAQFSKPAYKPMVDIFYKNGFFSYGKERNFDAMHWEINL